MAGTAPPAAPSPAPLLWLVIGDKLGDNAQVEVIADALGWRTERKRLRFLAQYVTGKPPFKPSLYHIDQAASDPLEPPWPDVVLTIGRRPSMAALWIKQQSAGRTKVVIIGRPRRLLSQFDLVIAPPQYPLPARGSILPLALPLFRPDRAAIAAAGEAWAQRLATLPRPITAVLVGGPTGPFRFDAAVTGDFVARILQTTGGAGTLYVTTSRRTPDAVAAELAESLPESAILYRWSAEAADNPYQALLALADQFIVTGDSASMIVEVAQLGRPLAIFPLPQKASRLAQARAWLADALQPVGGGQATALAALGDWLYDRGIALASREFETLWAALISRGLAVRLGEPFPAAPPPPPDDLPQVVARMQALVRG
jgi:hypothetical protein